MESIIKNNNLGKLCAENAAAGFNTLNVSRVMKGSEVAKAADAFNNFVCNENAFVEESTALNNSVTDSGNFVKAFKNLAFALCENFLNFEESGCVVCKGNFILKLAAVCC